MAYEQNDKTGVNTENTIHKTDVSAKKTSMIPIAIALAIALVIAIIGYMYFLPADAPSMQ